MADWYCVVNGQQYGPIPLETLQGWAREGRLTPADNVWTQGMAQWAPAGTVPGLFAAGAVVTPAPAGPPGQTPNAEINLQARALLHGRWGLAIGFSLLLGLLSGGVQAVPKMGPLVALVLGGPLQLGAAIFFLAYVRRQNADIEMLFAGFKNFGNAVGAYLLMVLFTLLWMLLFIIPGIIAALSYSQIFYLLADNPQLGPMEALRQSKEMMRGYKAKLFCLGLRYAGWSLLCIFTLFIGYIWLIPYARTGMARFYEDLRGAPAVPEPTPPATI
jgi:uncharacterized membrane protein